MTQPNKALIIIDLQNEFLASAGRYRILDSSKDALLANLSTLVPEFRKNGHIIWVKSTYDTQGGSQAEDSDSESPTGSSTFNPRTYITRLAGTHKGKYPCCPAGSINAEIYPAASALIISDADTIITKTNYSAFKDTSLLSTLRAKSVKYAYFCGLLSTTCVLATLVDAIQLDGFKIYAVSDCLGWRKEKSHTRALWRMRDMRVNMLESREACSEDTGDHVLSIPELYYVNGSIPSWRVQIALYEKGIEVSQIRLKVMTHPKPTRLPAFLALNHRGKTPVFVDTDDQHTTVNESLAILSYLETYYPQASLLPPIEQRKYRARILSLVQETENLHNAYDALEEAFFEARDSNKTTEFSTTIRPALLESLYKELAFWESYTSKTTGFIGGGDDFTMADCAFYPVLGYMVRRGFEFDERWPGLQKYHAAVWARNSAKKAQPEGWSGKGKTNIFHGT